jgi:hypothetical protein
MPALSIAKRLFEFMIFSLIDDCGDLRENVKLPSNIAVCVAAEKLNSEDSM